MPRNNASVALGLMSGTSADGITAALCRFSGRSVRVLAFKTYPFAPALKHKILGAPDLPLAEISKLNYEAGIAFAEAAQKFLKGRPRPAVIGSHGQTLWHGPDDSPANTLQIGEPSFIAEAIGVPTVADFRPRDMAAGGQGAPLVAAFDEFLFFRRNGRPTAVQNIGGVANVTFIGPRGVTASFDTGPGNALMDLAARLGGQGRLEMDAGGRLAARGRADDKILARMMAHPYFRQTPPKSIDKNLFGPQFLRRHFGTVTPKKLPDVLATLSWFTARSIADAYRRFGSKGISTAVISGGGAKNTVLMRRLSEALAPVRVLPSDRYGIPVMAKEAAAFAWLAWRAVHRLPNNCPKATGARGPRVLGKIIPA
ncbi:MAG: anhydro-N-acetylmuramic acid kinase [Elusimicrobia bacterium]|nr:anhydro-N-acetylmuramic acid kinase [Elusimicrobiota bacterium]